MNEKTNRMKATAIGRLSIEIAQAKPVVPTKKFTTEVTTKISSPTAMADNLISDSIFNVRYEGHAEAGEARRSMSALWKTWASSSLAST